MENILFAFIMSLIAGLSTTIGAIIGYRIKKPKVSYLAFALGLSGGVMIYVSFMELLPDGIERLGQGKGTLYFFLGMFSIMILDFIIPDIENPHHFKYTEDINQKVLQACQDGNRKLGKRKYKRKFQEEEIKEILGENVEIKDGILPKSACEGLMKTGTLTAIAIAIHNFPEGIATFGVALGDAKLGIIIMLAVALHNIPEGISVYIPIYYATRNKKKSFLYAFLSGIAEPIGAFIGYLVLRPYLSESLIAGLLAFVAGIMVYITFDEILPAANRYENGHLMICGLLLGMLIMALSLLIL